MIVDKKYTRKHTLDIVFLTPTESIIHTHYHLQHIPFSITSTKIMYSVKKNHDMAHYILSKLLTIIEIINNRIKQIYENKPITLSGLRWIDFLNKIIQSLTVHPQKIMQAAVL